MVSTLVLTMSSKYCLVPNLIGDIGDIGDKGDKGDIGDIGDISDIGDIEEKRWMQRLSSIVPKGLNLMD